MTWGIWNKNQEGWVGFNNVIFSTSSRAVCAAQIDLLNRMVKQQIKNQRERDRAEQAQKGKPTQGLVIPGRNGKPIPVGAAIWEPLTIPPSPFEPRQFEKWYQEKRKGQSDD